MKILFVMAFAALSIAGCSDDTSCSIDDDCFRGEICQSGSCVEGSRANNITTNNDNNAGNNASNNVAENNSDHDNNVAGGTCVIDPIGNTCDDDEYEENDLWQQESMATDQEAWCQDGELATPVQTFSGTLCPGDGADHFRMQIDNRSADACLADQFTISITVELEQTCDPANLKIVPYNFFDNPTLNSICGERETVRCEISNEGRTYQIDWVLQSQQFVDPRLMISTDRDDIEIDYTVTMEIIQ